MSKHNLLRTAMAFLVALVLRGGPAMAQSAPPAAKGKVSASLLALTAPGEANARRATAPGSLLATTPSPLLVAGPLVHDGYVLIEAVATTADGRQLLTDLQAQGLRDGAVAGALVSGRLPVGALAKLQNLASLRQLRPGDEPHQRVGSVTSQGDRAEHSDIARRKFGLSGKGIKVGVLSNSYNLLGGAAAGVASGDLPPDLQVVAESPVPLPSPPPFSTDEGRAMAEIVHDVAPEAKIAFATALGGQPAFAQNILKLRDAGCDIIVDDIFYFAEPFFENGVVAQAVEQVNRQGKLYFSAAGNQAQQSYEARFRPSGIQLPNLGEAHAFAPDSIFQRVTVAPGATFSPVLQWDDPFFSANGVRGAQTDLDLYLLFNGQIIAASTDNNLGGDPIEGFIGLTNLGNVPATLQVLIVRAAGPNPSRIKYVNFGDTPLRVQYDTQSSTLVGHPNTPGAVAVAAAAYFNTPIFNSSLPRAVVEDFSSLGGTPILFGEGGQRLARPRVLPKPDITGPDQVNTTFFVAGFDPDRDGFPNFPGTSAAAPHLAAVAALQLEASPTRLSPLVYRGLLISTAQLMQNPLTPNIGPGFNFKTGFGFVQADAAVAPLARVRQVLGQGSLLFSLFPNPSRGGRVTFDVTAPAGRAIRLAVVNGMGQEVFSQSGTESLSISPDLSALPKGIYIAKVQTDAEVVTRQLQLD